MQNCSYLRYIVNGTLQSTFIIIITDMFHS